MSKWQLKSTISRSYFLCQSSNRLFVCFVAVYHELRVSIIKGNAHMKFKHISVVWFYRVPAQGSAFKTKVDDLFSLVRQGHEPVPYKDPPANRPSCQQTRSRSAYINYFVVAVVRDGMLQTSRLQILVVIWWRAATLHVPTVSISMPPAWLPTFTTTKTGIVPLRVRIL